MSKKLLLTTILSSVMIAAPAAQAAILNASYDGGNKFTLNGTQYNGFVALNTFIKAEVDADRLDLNEANLQILPTTQALLITDLLNTDGVLFKDLATVAAQEVGVTPEEFIAKATPGINAFRTIAASGVDLTTIIDFEDLFENDAKELEHAYNWAIQKAASIENKQKANEQFTALKTKLAANNTQLQALITEEATLIANINRTAEETARLREVNRIIHSNAGFEKLRSSPEAHEALKHIIAQIKVAKESLVNSKLSARAITELATLKDELGRYLDENPTTALLGSKVQASDTAVSDSLIASSHLTTGIIDGRISDTSGLAAGDIFDSYGIWAKGSFTRGTQKAHGNAPGYKFDQKGVTIGADAGDESMIGLVYSFFKNDVKNKEVSSNKEDITSHTVTVYGRYAATDEIFLNGQGQFGKANIKKKRATGDIANNIASAKTDAQTIAAKAEVGYNYAINSEVQIIPTVGVSYTNVKVDGYTETGNGLNRSVAKRTTNRTSGIAGVTAQYVSDIGSMKLIPEVHANIDYAFNSKNSDTVVTIIDGIAPIATPSEKLTKAHYNVGTSVKAIESDMYEISAGYDLGFAKKFQSHTGTLKLRINL